MKGVFDYHIYCARSDRVNGKHASPPYFVNPKDPCQRLKKHSAPLAFNFYIHSTKTYAYSLYSLIVVDNNHNLQFTLCVFRNLYFSISSHIFSFDDSQVCDVCTWQV